MYRLLQIRGSSFEFRNDNRDEVGSTEAKLRI